MGIAKIAIVGLLAVGVTTAILLNAFDPQTAPARASRAEEPLAPMPGGKVRDFTLELVPTQIDTGAGIWHAWTFNGTVPGPTLEAEVGDVLRVTVVNRLGLTHSFHTHLVPDGLASDGSQLNSITGIGGMAMIPPGESYTYTLRATVPGLNYYHCHSADGGHTISEHMAQGLYGAILVKERDAEPFRTEVVFMGERGFNVTDHNAPYFVMNGKGLPGGEHELERVFAEQGVPGVVAQLGHTVPVMRGRVGEPVEIAIINIGDAVHSFHLHGMVATSQEQQPGHLVPAQVVQLVPGAVDRIRLTPTHAGLWLFHCHVVTHADQGMIGVFLVDPEEGELDLPDAAPHSAGSNHTETEPAAAAGGAEATQIRIVAGADGDELAFGPANLSAPAGKVVVQFTNEGRAPHSLSFPGLGVASGTIAPGASRTLTLAVPRPGSYEFVCAEPGHAGAGMEGVLQAT